MMHLTMWSKNSPLRNDWYNFAVELVGKGSAENIHHKHTGGGNHLALKRMLVFWDKSTTDLSWQVIVDALKEMDEPQVIESIKKECQNTEDT